VFRYKDIEKIPAQYQPSRWQRHVLPDKVNDIAKRYSVDGDTESMLINEIMDVVDQCIDRLRRNPEKLVDLATQLKAIKNSIFEEVPDEPEHTNKRAVISDILKQPEPDEVLINPPQGIRNKGCGTNHRLIGPGEKAVENHKKNPRLCHMCNKYVYDHDSRNCRKVTTAKEAAAAAAKEAVSAGAREDSAAGVRDDSSSGSREAATSCVRKATAAGARKAGSTGARKAASASYK